MGDTIKRIRAQKILDSRGNWTIEVDIVSKQGLLGKGKAPSGASVGIHEAKVIGVEKAVKAANSFLKKMNDVPLNQKSIDERLIEIDGTENFSKIGGNTAIALSLAVYDMLNKDVEKKKHIFPYPLGNVFGGGKHGGGTDIQEFLLCPTKSKSFPESVGRMLDTYHEIKAEIGKKYNTGINDEGAITAKMPLDKALDIVSKISARNECRLGIDVAASSMWDGKNYVYTKLKKTFERGDNIDFISDLITSYGLFYVEDPMHETDFEGFFEITKKHGKKCLISGDDLTTTNPKYLKTAIAHKSINSAIVKPNQIGIVSLAHEFTLLAKKKGIIPVISHRSAETTDSTISVMSVDWEIPLIKAGAVDIRIAKLNRLLDMWDNSKKPRMAALK